MCHLLPVAGKVTALIGPSGGGKTTVSRLASRFWDIDRGKITIGGMDISKTDPGNTYVNVFYRISGCNTF